MASAKPRRSATTTLAGRLNAAGDSDLVAAHGWSSEVKRNPWSRPALLAALWHQTVAQACSQRVANSSVISSTALLAGCAWNLVGLAVAAPRRFGACAKSIQPAHLLKNEAKGRVMSEIKGDLLARRRVNLNIFVIRETNDSRLGWREYPPAVSNLKCNTLPTG